MQRITLAAAIKKRKLSCDGVARLVAEKSGRTIHKSTISRLARQVTKPQHDTVTALEQALDLKPGQLVFEAA